MLSALMLLTFTTSCSPAPKPQPPNKTQTTVTSSPTASVPCSSAPQPPNKTSPAAYYSSAILAAKENPVPDPLVGVWESARQNSNTTLAYRFATDGTYKYAGLLSYCMGPGRLYELTQIVQGTVQVEGDRITLRPTTDTVTRKNPENPQEDYENRPGPRTVQSFNWQAGDRTLTLTDPDGLQFVFRQVSA
ncbi:hypothetical protein KUF83_28915 [Streptomyces sp. BV286]|uniref:hypothetical protein n=1 Tax=Streptomyces sp. BV286 TaxID=2849672 RepID=UPI001C2E3C8C|nr:hypothetical protein [Streptomyces sp. BV286]MBV1940560.1 hypothetical protein [Streptomyces sp. BV286]